VLLALGGLLALIAVGSWVAALIAAARIMALVPAGQRWRNWFALGGWRFAEIRAAAGEAVDRPIRRYQLAFLVFMAAVICGAALGILLGAEAQNGAEVARGA
jgi:hypothetical protein